MLPTPAVLVDNFAVVYVRKIFCSGLGNADDVLGWHRATFARPLGRFDKVANSFDQFISYVRRE